MADISNYINAKISSVQTLFADTSTSSLAPTLPTDKDDSDTKWHIIAGSVAGELFIFIVAAVITWRCSKPKKRNSKSDGVTRKALTVGIYHEAHGMDSI
ncbi:hypothetical protein ACROYT_G041056 [Oculina patagonica]